MQVHDAPMARRRASRIARRALAWSCLAAGACGLWQLERVRAADAPAETPSAAAPAETPPEAPAPAPSSPAASETPAASPPVAAPAPVPARAYVISIDGPVVADFAMLLREALEAAPVDAPVVVELRLRGGAPAAAVNMLEALAARRARAPVIVYAREVTGPGVLLLAAADRIYAREGCLFGPGAAPGAGGLPLPLGQLEKLSAPAPYRVELERAFFEDAFTLILGETTVKKSGAPLALTAAEAARPFGQPPQPLLVDAVVPNLDAGLRDFFGGKTFTAMTYSSGGFVPRDVLAPEPPAAAPMASAQPAATTAASDAPSISLANARATATDPASVYVVPIKGEISSPQLYILRRALKEAIEKKVSTVVLDMDTLGGELGTTLEMMEALAHFEGRTITYVNDKAVSAGSYIAIVTDEIWFAPTGTIGAAEVVTGEGADVQDSMKRKIESFMRARVRALAGASRYRADVQRAMMDPDFELKIGDEVINPEGKLLSLTAEEACKKYGEPPEPLLGSGIAPNVTAMLSLLYGPGGYEVKDFHLTWSERAAKWLMAISPVLIAIGMLLLVIEFKTPGFGIIGISGIGLLLVVFASHYLAGLAGYEPVALFAVGIVLIALELFVFTGTLVAGALGLLCLVASLVWAMTDVWPVEGFGLTPTSFTGPLLNLALAFALALAGFLLVMRFLPKTWVFHQLVNEAVVPRDNPAASAGGPLATSLPEPGTRGVAMTDLRPLGEVEIAGGRFQARALHGQIDRGEEIVVTGRKDFALAVRRADKA